MRTVEILEIRDCCQQSAAATAAMNDRPAIGSSIAGLPKYLELMLLTKSKDFRFHLDFAAAVFFFFECDCNIGVGGETNNIAFDLCNQANG